jgi:hypothetical protein
VTDHSPWGQPDPNQNPSGQPPGPGHGQPPYGQPPYGQPPYGQPPYGYGHPQPATGTNGFAIASLVLAFFCSILGLIFGIVALNQIKKRPQGGRGLAIAGIVISVLGMIAGAIVVAGR